MMKIFALYAMLAPALLWPQAAKEEPQHITKVVRIQNARPEKIADMVTGGGQAIVRANDGLRAIVIQGKPAAVATIEQAIRELDTASTVTSRDVELMVYLVSGSSTLPASATPAEKLAALAPVVKQLRAIFPYSDYQLLSTMLLRSGEGSKASSNGVLKAFQNAPTISPSTYSIGYDSATMSPETTNSTIHLEHFYFHTRINIGIGPQSGTFTQSQNFDIGIQTDVDLQDGQKVVVGKSNIENADSALFVILSAKLVR